MQERTEGYIQQLEAWFKLLNEAENFPSKEEDLSGEFVVEITVAEVLGVGHYLMKPRKVMVVRDTEDKTWLLEETHEDDGKLRGLVSSYNVRVGMKFRLRIKKFIRHETRVFPHMPEEAVTL